MVITTFYINTVSTIGVLFGCVGRKLAWQFLVIYQGTPSISSKSTPMLIQGSLKYTFCPFETWRLFKQK